MAGEWEAITDEIAKLLDARDDEPGEALFALLAMAAAIAVQVDVPLEHLESELRTQYAALRKGAAS